MHDMVYTQSESRITWILLVTFTALSLCCDIIILWNYWRHVRKRRQGYGHRVIAHVSISNLVFSASCFGYCLCHVLGVEMPERDFLCQSQGPVLYFTVGACVYILSTSSAYSYLVIIRGRIPSHRTENLMLASAWSISFVLVLGSRIVSWAKASLYDWGYRNEIWCAIQHSNKAAAAVVVGSIIAPPLLLMVFCYMRIYLHIRAIASNEMSKVLNKSKEARMYQLKAATVMATFVFVFMTSWSGVLVLIVVGGGTRTDAPWWAETLVIAFAHLSGFLNFVQYAATGFGKQVNKRDNSKHSSDASGSASKTNGYNGNPSMIKSQRTSLPPTVLNGDRGVRSSNGHGLEAGAVPELPELQAWEQQDWGFSISIEVH
ncbi:uncharacterized protein SPPG_05844 [Spizellomyces punctatus DAOM BR117]|uniref:G-protein coupled receptors family 1 profile domain-containing protein n=1 Tax=Spizellomyces punctatus (strain DAOM BR117) TaxID=645134 RepID=A0A0L0HDN2_SPIPD|nr:uncharacterized protein SPPG_05844 [Spizellomyces punctatus DAOM BR117]KNC98878.1 hypothetical protein SPPG_05844 [Spizellomyces punctatus DAOM BR117]|eukprot:XP_016606918.1 hypothetical protein SPPG_05844 [Spizellomyces punctatus DAOM BR117]